MRAIMPLLYASMKRQWSPRVGAFDASPWGHCTCEADVGVEAARATGQVSERCRFGGPMVATAAPRGAAEDWAEQGPSDDAVLELGAGAGFPEVSSAIVHAPWSTSFYGKWRRKEAIHGLEGAAYLLWLRHIARTHHSHQRRHVVVGNNLSLTCVLA